MIRSKEVRGLRHSLFLFGLLAILLLLVWIHAPASAQEKDQTPHFAGDIEDLKPLPPGGPAPRTGGHPDLSGVWYPNSGGTEIQIAYLSASPDVIAAKRQFDP